MSTNNEEKKHTEAERADAHILSVKHFEQTTGLGLCGPAALKIMLSHFGKDFSEGQLARLANATWKLGRGQGTEHSGMIRAAKKIGARVFAKEKGTVEELAYFVNKEKLPVIIGWFDKDGDRYNTPIDDHYSVVVSVTDKNIIIVDPALDATQAERWLSRETFPEIWFDFVGKDDSKVSWGWYMVVTFEKKRFDVKGGHYY